MPQSFLEGRLAKGMQIEGREARRGYADGRLVFIKETVIDLTWHDHGVTGQWIVDRIQNAYGGAPPAGEQIRFVVHPGIQLVAARVEEAFTLSADWWGVLGSCQVVLENHGYLLGRGGQGGNTGPGWQEEGYPGGTAIRSNGVVLQIANYGVIAGGGGGSGATGWYDGGPGNYNSTGGGGAPFGPGGPGNYGTNYRWWGSAGTFDTPGRSGAGPGGNQPGGAWGLRGSDGVFKRNGGGQFPVAGGQPGAAVVTNAGFMWIHRGDVRGAAP